MRFSQNVVFTTGAQDWQSLRAPILMILGSFFFKLNFLGIDLAKIHLQPLFFMPQGLKKKFFSQKWQFFVWTLTAFFLRPNLVIGKRQTLEKHLNFHFFFVRGQSNGQKRPHLAHRLKGRFFCSATYRNIPQLPWLKKIFLYTSIVLLNNKKNFESLSIVVFS